MKHVAYSTMEKNVSRTPSDETWSVSKITQINCWVLVIDTVCVCLLIHLPLCHSFLTMWIAFTVNRNRKRVWFSLLSLLEIHMNQKLIQNILWLKIIHKHYTYGVFLFSMWRLCCLCWEGSVISEIMIAHAVACSIQFLNDLRHAFLMHLLYFTSNT